MAKTAANRALSATGNPPGDAGQPSGADAVVAAPENLVPTARALPPNTVDQDLLRPTAVGDQGGIFVEPSSGKSLGRAPIRQQRADARRNREKILLAAEQAFRELGTSVQMEDVAHRAGVGVGTLYRHFPTKETLVAELATERFSGCIDDADSALDSADVWSSIEQFIYRTAEQMAADAGLRDTFAAACLAGGLCPDKRERLMQRVAALLDRAQDEGAMRGDVTTADIEALMSGLSTAIGNGGDWRRLASIVLAGLRAPATSTA